MRPAQNENQRPKGLSTRGAQAPKRTALGNITNNVRKQPSRAAKNAQLGNCQDENAFAQQKTFGGKAKSEPFAIFVDEEPQVQPQPQHLPEENEAMDDVENRLPSLNEAVMRLPTLPPTASIVDHENGESPMLLDQSDMDDSLVTEEMPVAPMVVDRDAFIEEVPEYAEDIYRYLLTVEHKHKPKPGFMRRQQDVTLSMRTILVDWLVEVSEEYKLHRETLFLAINYIDRFLSVMSVLRSKLQLVGAAAMFLAAKYEEIYPPDVAEFVYITDDTYTKKQVLRMEHLMLKVLAFDISPPTINWFCDRIIKAVHADDQTRFMCMYLTELVLMDMDKYLHYPNSLVAATSLCLANIILDADSPWPEECVQATGYTLEQLLPCLKEMHRMHRDAEDHPQQAIRDKYKHTK
ncbi:hypothetical protein BaRGS_00037604 [Batillaria attramentaria]|uniref:Cyclin A n=1 Tax=Batillaria attramentaria TaxID=370345 RepID=A0ABD0J8B9_9CAEN